MIMKMKIKLIILLTHDIIHSGKKKLIPGKIVISGYVNHMPACLQPVQRFWTAG